MPATGVAGAAVTRGCNVAWSLVPTAALSRGLAAGDDAALTDASTAPDGTLWVVGSRRSAPLVARREGGAWRVSSSRAFGASGALVAVDARTSAGVFAVGYVGVVVRWDGRTWRRMRVPSHVAELRDVAVGSSRSAWAIGRTRHARSRSVVLHWDGTGWKEVALPPGMRATVAITAIAVRGPITWLAGTDAAHTRPVVLRRDGSTWRSLRSPRLARDEYSEVYVTSLALAPDGDVVLLASEDLGADGMRHFVGRWDGARWSLERIARRVRSGGMSDAAFVPGGSVVAVGAEEYWSESEPRSSGAGMPSAVVSTRRASGWSTLRPLWSTIGYRKTSSRLRGSTLDSLAVTRDRVVWAVGTLMTGSEGRLSSRPLVLRGRCTE